MRPERCHGARFPRRVLLAAVLLLAAQAGAAAQERAVTRDEVREITSNLVCLCGCGNKTVSVCGCSNADAVTREVETMLRDGKTAEQIFAHYVNSGGVAVLAAPSKKGFDLLAWVLPFAGVLAAGAFLVFKVRRWHQASTRRETRILEERPASAASGTGDPYRERLNKELEKLD